jgi:hypothetical protein
MPAAAFSYLPADLTAQLPQLRTTCVEDFDARPNFLYVHGRCDAFSMRSSFRATASEMASIIASPAPAVLRARTAGGLPSSAAAQEASMAGMGGRWRHLLGDPALPAHAPAAATPCLELRPNHQ